jgi:hypothetical protein
MSDRLIRQANGNGEDLTPLEEEEPPTELDLEIDVMFHAQHITSIHLQEPTGKQYETAMRELINGTNAYTMERFKVTLIAQAARVDRSIVEGMRKRQIDKAFDFLARLLADGRPTGESLLPI